MSCMTIEERLWRVIFLVDKWLSDTFKIHHNKILGGSNTDQHSHTSTSLLYWENVNPCLNTVHFTSNILSSKLIILPCLITSDQGYDRVQVDDLVTYLAGSLGYFGLFMTSMDYLSLSSCSYPWEWESNIPPIVTWFLVINPVIRYHSVKHQYERPNCMNFWLQPNKS